MGSWRTAWVWWIAATIGALLASAALWLVAGQTWCGEETYDTPPGSTGDALCEAMVRPVVPWAVLAALPFLLALVGGFVGIRKRNRRLFRLALSMPFVVAAVAVFATLAIW